MWRADREENDEQQSHAVLKRGRPRSKAEHHSLERGEEWPSDSQHDETETETGLRRVVKEALQWDRC
jgi:hypothetical protein